MCPSGKEQDTPEQSGTNRTFTLKRVKRAGEQIASGLPFPCCWDWCIHVFDKRQEEKKRETLQWFRMSCMCVSVCVCLSEKVHQWCVYDTPFTSGGASWLSFFIPRSLMGLWWWWRGGPSAPVATAPTPPWADKGPPPPPPLPPEECCTLRSLLLSTRIYERKEIRTVWRGNMIWSTISDGSRLILNQASDKKTPHTPP